MKRSVTTVIPYTELEVATGNFDASRAPIDRVIIHTMVGTAQAAAARFDNPASKVSAHYGVKLDGSLIHWLEEYLTAYHAGDYAMNQRSIGIEHEDNGDYNGQRTDALYATSAKLVRDICQFYNIPIDRDHIKKHSEVSDAPTGCPDALDIDRIVREAQGQTQSQQATQIIIDDLRKARDDNWNKYQTEVQVNNDLIKQLQDEQKKNQDLRIVNDSLTKADADTGAQLIDAQHKVTDYKGFLDTISGVLNLPTPSDYTKVDIDTIVTQIHVLQTPVEAQIKPLQDHAIALNNQLPSLEKKDTSKKNKSLIQNISNFFNEIYQKLK